MSPRGGRRRAALLVALGLVLGLGLGATLLVRPLGDVAAATPPRVGWNQTHRVDLPAGWTVTARNVGPEEESTSLSGPADHGCLVAVWPSRPGGPSRPVYPRAVTVQGHQGLYGALDPDYGPYPRAVVWREDGRRWVGVSCDLDEQGILAVAERVRRAAQPVHLPFRLAAVPPGLSVVQLIESFDRGQHVGAALFEAEGPSGRLVMQIANEADRPVLGAAGEAGRIGDRPVEIRPARQSICFPTRSAPVCVSGPGGEPASNWSSPEARNWAVDTAELLSPVEDPGDDAEWPDADEAIPD